MTRSYPPINPRAPFIWYGGDYYPEQWPAAIVPIDIDLMRQAHINVATLGVFAWTALQPAPDTYTFAWMDRVMDQLAESGRSVFLATPSAAQPAWMSRLYPDMLRVSADGQRTHHRHRVNYCPTSPDYRREIAAMAHQLGSRYKDHPALIGWHVSNEYSGYCYCDRCAAHFRAWLQRRYQSLDDLNAAWWTRFWSHTYTAWEEIEPPYAHGETLVHALMLDWRRFMTEITLECYTIERDILKSYTPTVPVTTNFMMLFNDFDYRVWAREVDVVGWDAYPHTFCSPAEIAFHHSVFRGLRDGQPFMLIEQTPSSINWAPYSTLQPPGQMRLRSYQAVAQGADTVMFFQWRRSRGNSEKYHGAIVEHHHRTDTRVFREVARLGGELAHLGDRTLGGSVTARVAILFDWGNRWAHQESWGPMRTKHYEQTVQQHYAAYWRQHVTCDIVFADSDLSPYAIVVAPLLSMIPPGMAERLTAYVAQGGTLVMTCMSGMVDDHDLVFPDGYPGPLTELLGYWSEELAPLMPHEQNTLVYPDGRTFVARHLCEIIHPTTATVLATFGEAFFAGSPALLRNAVGAGQAFTIATYPDDVFLDSFYASLLAQHDITPLFPLPDGVELSERVSDRGTTWFLLNHTQQPVTIALPADRVLTDLLRDAPVAGNLTLEGYGVVVLDVR